MGNLAQLQQYFTVYQTPPFPAGSQPLTVAGKQVAIATADLSDRELALLAAFTAPATPQSPWAQFLLGHGQAPSVAPVRLIHFATTITSAGADADTWLAAFISLFASSPSGFFLTADTGILVEPANALTISRDDLAGMLDTLDGDFDTNTRAYLGHVWPVSPALPALAAEEGELAATTVTRVASLQDAGLPFYTQAARASSPILTALRQRLEAVGDMAPVIASLYAHQGNQSATAKALYLHRNTLQYRLDKFQQHTGFNLKNMDDLVLCQLLLQGD